MENRAINDTRILGEMDEKLFSHFISKKEKWASAQKNFKIGNLVLLKDTNLMKNQWSHARVRQVFPNKDGFVRYFELLKSDHSVCTRDIRNLCKLELDL